MRGSEETQGGGGQWGRAGAAAGAAAWARPALDRRFLPTAGCGGFGGISGASLGAGAALLPHPLPGGSNPPLPSLCLPSHPLLQLRPQMGFPASPRGLLSYFLTLHVLRLGSGRDPAGLGALSPLRGADVGQGRCRGAGGAEPRARPRMGFTFTLALDATPTSLALGHLQSRPAVLP